MQKTYNPYIDGLLWSVAWNTENLTYSFPASSVVYDLPYNEANSFVPFTAAQQAAVRQILVTFESFTLLKFTESDDGSLRFGRWAGGTHAYFPGTSERNGDIWLETSLDTSPLPGSYTYYALIHEIGHALGLKHPHEGQLLPHDADTIEGTVMSYQNIGPQLPQSPMVYDIQALQTLYGANYSFNSGDSIYTWSEETGAQSINGATVLTPWFNVIFSTVWDGGGNDTYDFSAYRSAVTIDLNPGAASTLSSQKALLKDGSRADNIWNALLFEGDQRSMIENAKGGSGNDVLTGNWLDNVLTGSCGNDAIHGGRGFDVAAFSGNKADYVISHVGANWIVSGVDGVDTLDGIEQLRFADDIFTIGPKEPTTTIDLMAAAESTLPVIAVYEYMVGTTPWSAEKLTALSEFVYDQIHSANYQATAMPMIGGYEAMGLGLAETLLDDSDLVDTAFISTHYSNLFARDASAAQINHFTRQLDYFEGLYVGTGIDPAQAELLSRGAVLGQMIGFSVLEHSSIETNAVGYLNALVSGDAVYGMSL